MIPQRKLFSFDFVLTTEEDSEEDSEEDLKGGNEEKRMFSTKRLIVSEVTASE